MEKCTEESSMERQEIYSQLIEMTPWLKRRECTPRIMEGVDLLLDQLIEIQTAEQLDKVLGGYNG